jgi:glutamine synthetase
MHTNYSTESTRHEGGFDIIIGMMDKLAAKHAEHILLYGKDNAQRLTGAHETSSMKKFSYNVANRGASVRIPTCTRDDKKGYFEDRRPAGNADPYLVSGMLVDTTLNEGVFGSEFVKSYQAQGFAYLKKGDSTY